MVETTAVIEDQAAVTTVDLAAVGIPHTGRNVGEHARRGCATQVGSLLARGERCQGKTALGALPGRFPRACWMVVG